VYSIVQRFYDHFIFSLDTSQFTPELIYFPRQPFNLLIPDLQQAICITLLALHYAQHALSTSIYCKNNMNKLLFKI